MATFNLTSQADSITGTAADDIINGGTAALQSVDVIDGGAGRDKLDSGTDPNGTQAPRISDVENIVLDTAGLPFSLANVSGARLISTDQASIIYEDVGQPELAYTYGALGVQSGTVDFRFVDGSLEGDDDTLSLFSDSSNVTFTSGSSFDSPGGPMNQTEDALRIENIDLVLRGPQGQAQFANQVDLSAFANLETLTLAGPSKSKVVVDSPELAQVDARATSGGITLTSDTATDQTILGGSGDDDFKTGAGNDTIEAAGGDNVVNAGGGDNTVSARDGNDEITTEGGADTINSGAGDDVIDSGSGRDEINAGGGNDEVVAGDQTDVVRGNAGDDTLRGGGGDDLLFDGRGNDAVFGGGDDDLFLAGMGDDTFNGGGGVDTFAFRSANYGTDTVEDFTLTSNGETNDRVVFKYQGQTERLQTQADFEIFDRQNPNALTVDNSTSTITIDGDGGTIILQASDTDFLAS